MTFQSVSLSIGQSMARRGLAAMTLSQNLQQHSLGGPVTEPDRRPG
jgi:hypothetical protein